MPAPPGREQAGDRRAGLAGEGGGAADVLETAFVVVPSGQQRPRSGRGAGDRGSPRGLCRALPDDATTMVLDWHGSRTGQRDTNGGSNA
ncbi:hypothetical protein [Streptomyces sp. NPDC047841]|uniref:hypothetical protein n=1 Tax=Streptomyces sp. NPDC047841 TaxID=3154708 RepID=UPI003455E96F